MRFRPVIYAKIVPPLSIFGVSMDIACLFAWGAWSMILFKFVQGIGTGGEVPVASAYINEFIGAKRRGRFFLLYEATFLVGLVGAGLIGSLLVPTYGWRAMFIVGLVPSCLMIPLRWFMSESPRWLAAKGRYDEADRIVSGLEESAIASGRPLSPLAPVATTTQPEAKSNWVRSAPNNGLISDVMASRFRAMRRR